MKSLEYRYPVDALYTGSSLGNYSAFARLSASTNLLGLWSAADNQYYVGEWSIRILVEGSSLQPQTTQFTPAYQRTVLSGASVEAEQTFCLSLPDNENSDPSGERLAIFLLVLRNKTSAPTRLTVRHKIVFPGVATDRFTKQPPADQLAKRVQIRNYDNYCTVTTEGRAEEVRIFGSAVRWELFSADATTLSADYTVSLHGGETRELSFVMAFSPDGVQEALKGFRAAKDGPAICRQATATMSRVLSQSYLFTPDSLINRAMQWAKVNMIRVRHRFRTGVSFTNDPPQDIVVVRDLGWFVLGSDYFLPELSHDMLEWALQFAVHDAGKLTEYLHADEANPIQHDYHLNINDDTPLFLWGMIHYAIASGDREFLSHHWKTVKDACNWILRQTEEGLVRCTAQGVNVWGICGWRNIIDDYTLSGAVTEVNAECYLALRLVSDTARVLGYTEDMNRFAAAAEALRREINTQLHSNTTGLYMLNVGVQGDAHHDSTGDLIFPVLAGVADDSMSENILRRLMKDDFWTEFGVRTVVPEDPQFDPDASYQLVGGVWPNLTAWVAYGLRSSHPEKVAEAMANIYRISEMPRPVDWGYVVPGQFPERLHGTDFRSRGMTLSPWTPPTFVWLGIEGLLGVKCTWETFELNPAIPATWEWVAVKDLQVHGAAVTAFLFEGILYATREVKSVHKVIVGAPLKTAMTDSRLFTAGLLVDDEILLFAAADESVEGVVRIEFRGTWREQSVNLGAGKAILLRIPTAG
jgi:glycogen debranching enzyme